MMPRHSLLLFTACLAASVPAFDVQFPDSCGSDQVRFDVKTEKNHPLPADPAEGKAQVIFIEGENQMVAPFSSATVRFGMDGSWIGAD